MSNDRTVLARIAQLPLPWRRSILRLIWRFEKARGRAAGFGLADTFVASLRLPRREAIALDGEAVFQDWLASMEWLSLLDRPAASIRPEIENRVRIDDDGVFARLAQWHKPILIAPLHMGCYSYAFTHIMNRHFADRRMLILRARDDREEETRVMQRISEVGCDMRFLKVSERSQFLAAMRFAREGAVVVSFIDLPASYGSPQDVTLFGRPARIALGIDSFARVIDATIVPISVSSGIGGDVVHVGQPFEVVDASAESHARVARIFVDHIERSVAADPAGWHMWQRLDEFLVDEAEENREVA